MKTQIIFVLITLISTRLVSAFPFMNRRDGGFIHLPIAVHYYHGGYHSNGGYPNGTMNGTSPNAAPVPVSIRNDRFSYEVQLGIGDNPIQYLTLQLDTGSSDIWVYGSGSCNICEGGVYDPSRATPTTLSPFAIEYFDGTQDSGYYVQDSIHLGATTVTSVIIAVATSSVDRGNSVMGVGMNGLEATNTPYQGFIDDLVNQGIISKRAYSVYLDNLASSTGGLILGGYDPSKYQGSLTALPIVLAEDGASRLAVEWDSISITGANGATTQYTSISRPFPKSGTLDTGFSFTTLPDDVLEQFAIVFGGTINSNGVVILDNNPGCTLGQGFVNFGLGGGTVTISVPFSELAIQDTDGTCYLGFQEVGDDPVLSLGDTFLRSAYVVYDFDAMTISLAQATYDSTCTDCVIPL